MSALAKKAELVKDKESNTFSIELIIELSVSRHFFRSRKFQNNRILDKTYPNF